MVRYTASILNLNFCQSYVNLQIICCGTVNMYL